MIDTPPLEVMSNPGIFWVVLTTCGILLSIVIFLVRYMFTDIKNTLQSTIQTLNILNETIKVFDIRLNNQKEMVTLLREDLKATVEKILTDYNDLCEIVQQSEEKRLQLADSVKELRFQFELCQQRCCTHGGVTPSTK